MLKRNALQVLEQLEREAYFQNQQDLVYQLRNIITAISQMQIMKPRQF